MTDDIREGLRYIVGHVHAPPLQQAPVLACGLPSMPTKESVEKLYAIQQARDWIQDQIDKAKEEENTQEPLPFNSVESTPESYHEETGAATEPTAKTIEVPQVVKVSQRRGIIYVNGTAYETYTDAARAFNIHPESLRRRLKRGWSIGQALELQPPPRAVIFKGTVYPTLSHACRAQGVSYHVARKRIKEGKMPDVVIKEMLREKLLSHIAPR